LITACPPYNVPKAIKIPEPKITQNGTLNSLKNPPANKEAVIIPMAFWVSFIPWERETAEAEKIWPKRKNWEILKGGSFEKKILISQEKTKIKKMATKNPIIGAKIIPLAILIKPLVLKAEIPTETRAAPNNPPTKEWVTEIGMPNLVDRTTQITAPIRAKIKSGWEITSGKTIPLPMVLATSVVIKAPERLKTAAKKIALLKERARVEIVVAIELAQSFAPFQKS